MFVIRILGELLGVVWRTIQPALRFIGWTLFLLAVISLVHDYTYWQIDEAAPAYTSLGDHLRSVAPGSLTKFETAITNRLHPLIWDPVLTLILNSPAWLSLGLFGALATYAGLPRRGIDLFVN